MKAAIPLKCDGECQRAAELEPARDEELSAEAKFCPQN